MTNERRAVIVLVAALAILAYLPLFTQPLLQDDYPNIEQARLFGPPSGWGDMLQHPVFRYRVTFWLLTSWIDALFGPSARAFYAASIALHVLAVWILYALGAWRAVGWRVSAAAAAFFAVYEGHQEAVMWYSASCETLAFVFGALSLLCWIHFIERGNKRWYAGALASFVLALATKESAVVFAPLLLLPLWGAVRKRLLAWMPFAALALGDAALIFANKTQSFRFQDGSFSLHAPFWITWPVSYGRLLWPWGFTALALLALLGFRRYRGLIGIAALWMGAALAPYSFLTYMHRIPSRQTYLASAGLAWIAGAAFCALHARLRRHRRAALALLVVGVLGVNIAYLWTKKRHQFLERAAPTEALIALANRTRGPIFMRCYSDPAIIADAAVRLRANQPAPTLIWNPTDRAQSAAEFCWPAK
jgi:hypothetical protein